MTSKDAVGFDAYVAIITTGQSYFIVEIRP